MKVDNLLRRGANSLDFIRFLAASTVVFSHSFVLVNGSLSGEWLTRLTGGHLASGNLAVFVFFAISGYLVTASIERRPDLTTYLWARLLRIYPALIVVLLLTTFVIGPLVTTEADYFSLRETYTYFWSNLFLLDTQRDLPGVFLQHARSAVNAPLWTLGKEVLCYLALAALAASRLLTKRVSLVIAIGLVLELVALSALRQELFMWWILNFAVGSAIYQYRHEIPWRRDIALGGLALVLLAWATPYAYLVTSTVGAYVILAAGTSPRFGGFSRRGDFSYGIYIWGMPVQQLAIMALPTLTWWQHLGVAYPIVVLVGVASWFVVERPALSLKRLIAARRSPGTSPRLPVGG